MSDIDNIDDLINDEETYDVITFEDENGKEIEYFVIDGIEVDGVNYILVVDSESYKDENDDTQARILKETAAEGEDAIYEEVSDDAEYQKVVVLLQENDPDYEMEFND